MLTSTASDRGPSSTMLVPVRDDGNANGAVALSSPPSSHMDYREYRVRVDYMKENFNRAVAAEQDACARVKGVQADLMQLLVDPKLKDRYDLQQAKQLELQEAEAAWHNCALFTAEMRNEIADLAKQRDGDYSDEFKFCGVHSLDHCKPVPLTSSDISPHRRQLVRDAYPEVAPEFGFNAAQPSAALTEDAHRTAFRELDTEKLGYITLRTMVKHLEAKGDFGVPDFAEKFVFRTLKSLNSPPIDGDKLVFEQFCCLMLRWAAL